MHMADALVVPQTAALMYGCSVSAMGYSIKKVRNMDENNKNIPVMGIMGAFVFAAQMINFTIPGTGSSGHLCGGMLLSVVLGPEAGFLTMIGVLLIQCLLFADGGLLALGCNIWNMAFYGCFIGAGVIWKLIMKSGVSKKKIMISSILGCMITLQMGAFSVVVETLASGITELPFNVFITLMLSIHLAIGLVEGLITSAVLCFIYDARPEMLWLPDKDKSENKANISINKKRCLSLKTIIVIFAVVTVIIGGILSLAASSNPDGLEWSIVNITGSTELENTGEIQNIAEKIQDTTSIFPDYSLKNSDNILGTSISGIIGAIVVLGLCVCTGVIVRAIGRSMKRKR